METKAKVLEIAQAVSRAGGRAMLVGGCVRDSLLGIPVKDYDLEIYALDSARLLAALEKVCEVDAVGMSFGVLKVKHFDIDIALPRLDSKTGRGHRGFVVEVDPYLDFSLASSRRDFTVNAIMQDALTGEIIDPWNGQKDLQKGIFPILPKLFQKGLSIAFFFFGFSYLVFSSSSLSTKKYLPYSFFT